ncbi:hypothetical protein G9A89_012602 [Geosiphon pyriformis]|nr:hypothetical protein G9A89_012602 [Geosiphon pyriformis]
MLNIFSNFGQRKQTRLTRLDYLASDFQKIAQRFQLTLPSAKIIAIFELELPKKISKKFNKLQESLARGSDISAITQRMFLDTMTTCDASDLLEIGRPCKLNSCEMCKIIKRGNKCIKTPRPKNNELLGIWSAKNANLADSFCEDVGTLRKMFVLDILSPVSAETLVVYSNSAAIPRFLILYELLATTNND